MVRTRKKGTRKPGEAKDCAQAGKIRSRNDSDASHNWVLNDVHFGGR